LNCGWLMTIRVCMSSADDFQFAAPAAIETGGAGFCYVDGAGEQTLITRSGCM
jgi:hypothetical protein